MFDSGLVGVLYFDFDGGDFDGVGDLDDDFLSAGGSIVCGVVYFGDDGWAEEVGHSHIVWGYVTAFFGFGGVVGF